MPRKVFKDSDEEETTGLFDFSDDEDEKENKKLKALEKELVSDNEEHLEEDSDNKDSEVSDSDDAPEDVSFHAGKESAMAQIKDMLQMIKDEKKLLKEKRKKTDELFKSQKAKKQRLEYLTNRRLPDDVVANLKTPVKDAAPDSPSENESEIETPANEEDEVVISSRLLASSSCDFLPLDTSKPHARTFRNVKKTELSSKDALLAFKQNALYGGRIPRQSVKATMAQQQKRNATSQPTDRQRMKMEKKKRVKMEKKMNKRKKRNAARPEVATMNQRQKAKQERKMVKRQKEKGRVPD